MGLESESNRNLSILIFCMLTVAETTNGDEMTPENTRTKKRVKTEPQKTGKKKKKKGTRKEWRERLEEKQDGCRPRSHAGRRSATEKVVPPRERSAGIRRRTDRGPLALAINR